MKLLPLALLVIVATVLVAADPESAEAPLKDEKGPLDKEAPTVPSVEIPQKLEGDLPKKDGRREGRFFGWPFYRRWGWGWGYPGWGYGYPPYGYSYGYPPYWG